MTTQGLYAWTISDYAKGEYELSFLKFQTKSGRRQLEKARVVYKGGFSRVLSQSDGERVEYALEDFKFYGSGVSRYRFLTCKSDGDCQSQSTITEASIKIDQLMITDSSGIAIIDGANKNIWQRKSDQR